MIDELTLAKAVALGGAVSFILGVLAVLVCAVLRRPVLAQMWAFFFMAAPILVAISLSTVLPLLGNTEAQGDSQEDVNYDWGDGAATTSQPEQDP